MSTYFLTFCRHCDQICCASCSCHNSWRIHRIDSWLIALLSSASCFFGTKSGFMISFTLNFLFNLLEEVEVDGLFPSLVGLLDEGIWSALVVSVLVEDLVGDLVRDFVRDLVGDFVGDFVEDFSGSISVEGVGSFVGDRGGVCVGDIDEDLGGEGLGEVDGDFVGKGGVAGSSSLMGIKLTYGESSMTSSSCKLFPEGFGMSKRTFFGFLLDEVIASIASLNVSEISCHACLMAASPSSLDVESSNLFLFVSLVWVGCASDQIWKARCRTFFWILGWLKSRS